MKRKTYLIIIDGPMGSGKSTAAKLLHKKLPNSALLSLDSIRRIISNFDLNNKEHHKIGIEILYVMIMTYLKNGYTTIVEKSITTNDDIERIEKLINKSIKKLFYRIEAPLDVRTKRVKERKIPSHLKKGSTLNKIKRNNMYYEKLKHERTNRIFDSTKLTPQQIVNKILKDAPIQKVALAQV